MREHRYTVDRHKQVRVIIDTDCDCEADDQFAVLHHLMTPKIDVVGIVAEHFADRFGEGSEESSYKEIKKVLNLAGMEDKVPVYHGCSHALQDESTPNPSEAAEFIIQEALKDDDRALFIAGQGALSNVASAYLMNPAIKDRLTLIWIGGGTYPNGESEFNLENDVNAANVVFGSGMEIWQVPKNLYSKMYVPLSVLYEKVYPCGEIGKYLVEHIQDANARFLDWIKRPGYTKGAAAASYPGGEMWILGDSPTVGLIMFDERYSYHTAKAPRFHADGTYEYLETENTIRVYDEIDREFIMDDFYAKINYYFSDEK